jgi:hypothetical protein
MSDEAWDGFMALESPVYEHAIDLLAGLTAGPDAIPGADLDMWGRYSIVLDGECLVYFSLRADDETEGAPDGPYVYVLPPIPWP